MSGKLKKPQNTKSKVSSAGSTPSLRSTTTSPQAPAEEDEETLSYTQLLDTLKKNYFQITPKRISILDSFLVFLLLMAALQTFYIILAGSFPFNSYLSSLAASVGTFTLALGLRLQLMKPEQFNNVTPERAFADFLLCNLLLHVAVVTFLG